MRNGPSAPQRSRSGAAQRSLFARPERAALHGAMLRRRCLAAARLAPRTFPLLPRRLPPPRISALAVHTLPLPRASAIFSVRWASSRRGPSPEARALNEEVKAARFADELLAIFRRTERERVDYFQLQRCGAALAA